MTGNGVSHRGEGSVESGAVKFLQKNKGKRSTCSSRGLKKKGKMSSLKSVHAFKIVELKYTLH